MKKVHNTEVYDWHEIKARHQWKTLLLGNGASIALHSGFHYTSLYNAAIQNSTLNPSAQSVFNALHTDNFENTLTACWHAAEVCQALSIPAPTLSTLYNHIQQSLIQTVHSIHCPHQQLNTSGDLGRIATYAALFDQVITFNYDLTLYWAISHCNYRINSKAFKDYFINGLFDPALFANYKKEPPPTVTRVAYPHGMLALTRDSFGTERKVQASYQNILSTATSQWNQGRAPCYVSEGVPQNALPSAASGHMRKKLDSIRASPYLSTVYDEALSNVDDSLVVYGLNFNPQDSHITDALKRSSRQTPIQKAAIAVHNPSPTTFSNYLSALSFMSPSQITFFDASSSGCWKNP